MNFSKQENETVRGYFTTDFKGLSFATPMKEPMSLFKNTKGGEPGGVVHFSWGWGPL